MATSYEQHDKAFQQVSAYVIAKGGQRVATIAFKFPRDGAGRLYAYVHWLGLEMVRGHAGGYGYDKQTAAASAAANTLMAATGRAWILATGHWLAEEHIAYQAFCRALRQDSGHHWDSALREAGFDVWQAV